MWKAKTKRHFRKGTRIVTRLVEVTGIPHGYSSAVAWFAERMVLAGICLAVLSFTAGVLFSVRLAEPIVQSQAYNDALIKTRYATQGVKVYSQHVIDIASPVFAALVKENRTEDLNAKQMAERKQKLKEYLESKKSPLAKDDAALTALAESKNMKMIVAISFVESTFCKNHYYHNCSGIGGTPPNLRQYDSYSEWIEDFDILLEKRYKDVPPEDFIGLYVQPGSPNWLYGVKQVLREFDEKGIA